MKRFFLNMLLALALVLAPCRASADGGDVIGALVGVLGSLGMYDAYFYAILDAGNNSINQEQTRLYDIEHNGHDGNAVDAATVDSVMARLLAKGEYVLDVRSLPFRWHINGNEEFNAACFPTNFISVNKGLVRSLNRNRDELAGVLAHEMTHGLRLHAAYTYARAAAQSFGIQAIGMVARVDDPGAVAILADYSVAKNIMLPVEYEADEGGFYLAASAGYNPGGSAASMARMRFLSEHPETFTAGYDAEPYDHPDTDKREARLSQMLTDYSCGHVTVVNRRDVHVDGEYLLTATYASDEYDDTAEQAYLIAGGLAKAFHDNNDVDGWRLRPGENGRTEYLDDSPVYAALKAAVTAAHADGRLAALVRGAYADELRSGARYKMLSGENERYEKQMRRREQRNAGINVKHVDRLYNNADWYNDTYRPELAIVEAGRMADYVLTERQSSMMFAVRGRALASLGKFDAALADANRAVNFDATFAYAYLNRAEVYRMMGKPQEALADIERAIAADPNVLAAKEMRHDINVELGVESNDDNGQQPKPDAGQQ